MRERIVVPSICSRDIACAEWSDVRRFEHFLQLLDVVNDPFNVHSVSISNISTAAVKRNGINGMPARAPARGRRAADQSPGDCRCVCTRDEGVPLCMSRIHPECPGSDPSGPSVAAEVRLREAPGEDEEEDENDDKEKGDDDDDDTTDDGYSE
jgi:hypothetical protein